jgi:hypothetical protein
MKRVAEAEKAGSTPDNIIYFSPHSERMSNSSTPHEK